MFDHLKRYTGSLLFLFLTLSGFSQPTGTQRPIPGIRSLQPGVFGVENVFTENIGQYGETFPGYEHMGKILFGYEGFGIAEPVLFTEKGIIHVHRKIRIPDREELIREERRKKRRGEGREEIRSERKVITMLWLDVNPEARLSMEDAVAPYRIYGMLPGKASGYKKVTVYDLYPGIDIEYSFIPGSTPGFEYKLFVKPGADPSLIQMKFGGDIYKQDVDKSGRLVVRSQIGDIIHSAPVAFTGEAGKQSPANCTMSYSRSEGLFRFKTNEYNKGQTLVIDPFISSTSSLNGSSLNSLKAKDIDFDYAGNVYVSGGGTNSSQLLAKYDPAGTLLWTFSGTLTAPTWQFGNSYGGWVVEKTSGSIYLGQGLAGSGFRVIRLTTAGVYDNYITTANTSFGENWKMLYSCRGGIGTILVAGGGGSANNELALLSPPSVNPATSNISGLSGGHNDISDLVMDPFTDEMFTIFSCSVLTSGADAFIYKHTPPYLAGNLAWRKPSTFFALREPANRPYLDGLDNSSNTIAINSSHLFYWDGKNLKAFDKASGSAVGSPLTFSSNSLLQNGGIFADECNNVFIGFPGMVKALKFNGTDFDDAAVPDIDITGFANKNVYDLAYDNGKKLLYASGQGFVASFSLLSYCQVGVYSVNVTVNCMASSAVATISPTPPAGTTISYVLYDGATALGTNGTGVFSGLAPGNYTIKVFLNQACGGTHAEKDFIITAQPLVTITDPPPACLPLTTDITQSSITAGSSSGLTWTYWQDVAATIPLTTPAAAPPGIYYIKGTTISGCYVIRQVSVTSLPAPVANAGPDGVICAGSNYQLHGSGGNSYLWTPSTYLDDPTRADPTILSAPSGTHIYHLTVTDANGCRSFVNEEVKILVGVSPKLNAGLDTVMAMNQPLQLNAIDVNNTGFISYTWTPAYGLNNPSIQNPVAILDQDIIYTVRASTASGCEGVDQVRIKVYKGPDIYVPSAFTPGKRDGLNDQLRPIPVGLKRFDYFRIYNRWGELVFSTSNPNLGWDGRIQGIEQTTGSFAWIAAGVDFNGNLIERKGLCTIVR